MAAHSRRTKGGLKSVAHSALLASITDDQAIDFREGRRSILEAGPSMSCSHLHTSWVRPDDLRELLRQAIDGGQNLRADLWHPLRAPVWHPAASASEIESKLRRAWNNHLEKAQLVPSDWYSIEITKLLNVFGHAVSTHGGIVSFLEKPADDARARRVSIPVSSNSRA